MPTSLVEWDLLNSLHDLAVPRRLPPLRMLQRPSLEGTGQGSTKKRARQVWGVVCFLKAASVLLSPGFHLCLLLSPWVSGGGKAQVFAKLMISLCAKLTGGWTSTQTLLMASLPPCWCPRSPPLVHCRLQPLPTPTPAALAPQSMPEPACPSQGSQNTRCSSQLWGVAVASLETTSAQGKATRGCWGQSHSSNSSQGSPTCMEPLPFITTFRAPWVEGDPISLSCWGLTRSETGLTGTLFRMSVKAVLSPPHQAPPLEQSLCPGHPYQWVPAHAKASYPPGFSAYHR